MGGSGGSTVSLPPDGVSFEPLLESTGTAAQASKEG
jgi:hypothetical protein